MAGVRLIAGSEIMRASLAAVGGILGFLVLLPSPVPAYTMPSAES